VLITIPNTFQLLNKLPVMLKSIAVRDWWVYVEALSHLGSLRIEEGSVICYVVRQCDLAHKGDALGCNTVTPRCVARFVLSKILKRAVSEGEIPDATDALIVELADPSMLTVHGELSSYPKEHLIAASLFRVGAKNKMLTIPVSFVCVKKAVYEASTPLSYRGLVNTIIIADRAGFRSHGDEGVLTESTPRNLVAYIRALFDSNQKCEDEALLFFYTIFPDAIKSNRFRVASGDRA
jgi:hypothetical protein